MPMYIWAHWQTNVRLSVLTIGSDTYPSPFVQQHTTEFFTQTLGSTGDQRNFVSHGAGMWMNQVWRINIDVQLIWASAL